MAEAMLARREPGRGGKGFQFFKRCPMSIYSLYPGNIFIIPIVDLPTKDGSFP